MDLKAATDEALLLGIQQQDVGALEELYDRHHRIALAVAYRVLPQQGVGGGRCAGGLSGGLETAVHL